MSANNILIRFSRVQKNTGDKITWYVRAQIVQTIAEQSGAIKYIKKSVCLLETPHYQVRELFIELVLVEFRKETAFLSNDFILRLHAKAINKAIATVLSEIDMIQTLRDEITAPRNTDRTIKNYIDNLDSFTDELTSVYKKINTRAVAQ